MLDLASLDFAEREAILLDFVGREAILDCSQDDPMLDTLVYSNPDLAKHIVTF